MFEKLQDLRYGENPHQRAAFYRDPGARGAAIATRAHRCRARTSRSTTSPMPTRPSSACGSSTRPPASSSSTPIPAASRSRRRSREAYEAAYRTDPTSAFGGIIAFNRELDAATARAITERQFVEVLAAPAVQAQAAQVLAAKPNVRVLVLGSSAPRPARRIELRSVTGGLLVQIARPCRPSPRRTYACVTRRQPTRAELADLLFAWRVCKFVKSNAIVFARDGATIGVGAGQMSRVYSSASPP